VRPIGAGDVTSCTLNPPYFLDPGTRQIHCVGASCQAHGNYAFQTLRGAIEGGGEPCHVCLPDWEDRLLKEKHALSIQGG
jgi:hypothetical protein